MERVRIKCPVCGAILEADDNPENYGKNVTCPNCKARNKFMFFQRLSSAPTTDEYSSTEIRGVFNDTIGALQDPLTGIKYPLKEGRNLIGRMTHNSPSTASIPISTDNRRMSRSHLFIDVIKGTDSRYHAYASNASNKNETRINGVILGDNDRISLKNQDNLYLSGTHLVYLGSTINDDTIINIK